MLIAYDLPNITICEVGETEKNARTGEKRICFVFFLFFFFFQESEIGLDFSLKGSYCDYLLRRTSCGLKNSHSGVDYGDILPNLTA